MTHTEPVAVFSGLQRLPMPERPTALDYICEEIQLQGYSIIPDFITEAQRQAVITEIDRLEAAEKARWSAEALKNINDGGVVRNPFLHSDAVVNVCFNAQTLAICEAIFGTQYILHVNRAVINEPGHEHPASVWHREPPYQNFTSSNPLALTFILAVDEATELTGGLRVLTGSHHWEKVPSDDYIRKNAIRTDVPARSMLVIDSALLHANSANKTKKRRSLVTIFTSPLIKQQTLITEMLRNDPAAMQRVAQLPRASFLLGFDTDPSPSDDAYRQMKIDRNLKIY